LIGAFTESSAAGFRAAQTEFGPVGVQRLFYSGALPASYPGSECAQVESSGSDVTCVISYKDPDLATNNVATFVRSIPATADVWLVFHHEPEGDRFPGPGSAGPTFVSDFVRNAAAIRSAAGCSDCQVKVAMVANGFQYQDRSPFDRGRSCGFIPPAASVDRYLVDMYEDRPTGQSLNRSPVADRWNAWLHCVNAANAASRDGARPLGLAEYGLGSQASDAVRAQTIRADAAYLPAALPGFALWNYWDMPRRTWTLDGHPKVIAAWRSVVARYRR
jgi:hypothetical protein